MITIHFQVDALYEGGNEVICVGNSVPTPPYYPPSDTLRIGDTIAHIYLVGGDFLRNPIFLSDATRQARKLAEEYIASL